MDPALRAALDRLKLRGLRNAADNLLEAADRQGWAPAEVLRVAVVVELATRDEDDRRARLAAAGFDVPADHAVGRRLVAQAAAEHDGHDAGDDLPDAVDAGLARLKLDVLRRHAAEIVRTATAQEWAPAEVLRTLVHMEVAARDDAARQRRRRAAGFPAPSTFEDYDLERSPVSAKTVSALADLGWARAHRNVCLLGPPSSGKTHLLLAMGHAAVDYGLRVRYLTSADVADARDLPRLDVVLIDDLGATRLDKRATAALGELAASADAMSIAFASRVPVRSWTRFLEPEAAASQVTDQLLEGALVVITARRPGAPDRGRAAATGSAVNG